MRMILKTTVGISQICLNRCHATRFFGSAAHRFDEDVFASEVTPPDVVRAQRPSGQVTVSWEPGTTMSVHGLAVFLIEFLHVTGLWAALRDRCPLQRTSPIAPDHCTPNLLPSWRPSQRSRTA